MKGLLRLVLMFEKVAAVRGRIWWAMSRFFSLPETSQEYGDGQ